MTGCAERPAYPLGDDAAVCKIALVQAWECSLPLRFPVDLGRLQYTTRDYVLLRLTTTDGLVGTAMGYTRGTPVLESVRRLAPALLAGPVTPMSFQSPHRDNFAPGWPALVRAASLIDIALWDVAAQHTGRSMAQALGGRERTVPTIAVAGFFAARRNLDELAAEAAGFVRAGASAVKLIMPGKDPGQDVDLLRAVHTALPQGVAVAVDFHAVFHTVDQAVEHCRPLFDVGLLFIEDPFPSWDWHRVTEFATRCPVPVASGEDLPFMGMLEDLVAGGVRVLRVDATASGGYTSLLPSLRRATDWGVEVVPHVWPAIHAPLASITDAVSLIEYIAPEVGAEPLHLLMAEATRDTETATPPPGLGLDFDLDAVGRAVTARWQSSARGEGRG